MHKCSEATKVEGDPDCASKEEIDDWLLHKRALFKIINNEVDFNMDSWHVRQNEQWADSIPLKSTLFSDTGYRFSKNLIELHDHLLPTPESDEVTFYDFIKFNCDTMEMGSNNNNTKIAEMYFRLDIDLMKHER